MKKSNTNMRLDGPQPWEAPQLLRLSTVIKDGPYMNTAENPYLQFPNIDIGTNPALNP